MAVDGDGAPFLAKRLRVVGRFIDRVVDQVFVCSKLDRLFACKLPCSVDWDNETYCTPSSAMLELSSEPICEAWKPHASASCLFVKSFASHVSTWAEPVTRSSQSG